MSNEKNNESISQDQAVKAQFREIVFKQPIIEIKSRGYYIRVPRKLINYGILIPSVPYFVKINLTSDCFSQVTDQTTISSEEFELFLKIIKNIKKICEEKSEDE